MPSLSRVFIKTSFLYLVSAFAIRLLIALQMTGLPTSLTPTFYHVFMVGWITQLIFGVAYWMLPKYSREHPRGRDALAWSVYIFLNMGLLMRIVAEPLFAQHPQVIWGSILVLSAILQWLAGLAFVINTWPRLQER